MRPRAVGGLEPDDVEQRELVELWHLSRVGLSTSPTVPTRAERIDWVVDMFCREHPNVARKWPYVWAIENLGRLTHGEHVRSEGPTNANAVPPSSRRRSRKKRAK